MSPPARARSQTEATEPPRSANAGNHRIPEPLGASPGWRGPLLVISLVVLAILFLYEFTNHLLLYTFSSWKAHFMTVPVVTALVTTVVALVLWRQKRLLQRAGEDQRIGAELLLREKQELIEKLISHAPVGIFVRDRVDGRYLLVNEEFAAIFGRRPGDMIGRSFKEIFPADWVAKLLVHDREALATGQTVVFEDSFPHADGTQRFVMVIRFPLTSGAGQVVALGGIIADLTERTRHEQERQRLQDQLRQAQKMEAVGRLASGIAHDFNNLLTVINGYSDLNLMSLGQENPLFQGMKAIQEAGHRAADLVRHLLLFSRKVVIQPRVLDLNELIARTSRMIERIVGEDIHLQLHLGSSLWPIKADPSQVEQVLMNLVVNARDAMPRGGELRIATRNVPGRDEADLLEGQESVELSVRDNGVGMDEATQARIFEPFFTTKEPDKGTGLGLATVYGIVTQTGGRIEVESQLGAGTTFHILLPTTKERAGTDCGETPVPIKAVTGETVLLVEDDHNVRNLAHTVLEGEGYRVLQASDGQQALQVCQQHSGPLPLVVTDMVMPSMSGPELVDRLRQHHPQVRVLFISGYAREALAELGPIGEDAGYLHKPFLPRELVQAVAALLNQNQPLLHGHG